RSSRRSSSSRRQKRGFQVVLFRSLPRELRRNLARNRVQEGIKMELLESMMGLPSLVEPQRLWKLTRGSLIFPSESCRYRSSSCAVRKKAQLGAQSHCVEKKSRRGYTPPQRVRPRRLTSQLAPGTAWLPLGHSSDALELRSEVLSYFQNGFQEHFS